MKLKNNLENIDFIGDNHIGTSSETPIRPDAFELSSDEKINIIKADVQHIMETLGLDLSATSWSARHCITLRCFALGFMGLARNALDWIALCACRPVPAGTRFDGRSLGLDLNGTWI